jgi:hypothetical protein
MADDGRTAELAEFAESYSNDVLETKERSFRWTRIRTVSPSLGCCFS